jgi:3-phosphoshikimate 1-carboxyvinyltransferase
MGISVARSNPIEGEFDAPASKPQTQRALIMAALADGVSTIHYPLIARETLLMLGACRSLGAEILAHDSRLEVHGIGSRFSDNTSPAGVVNPRYIWAGGSALIARLSLAIGSALPETVIVDGNCNLRSRPFSPLLKAIQATGAEFRFFDSRSPLPCAAVSPALPGGHYRLGTDMSSQFITALLIAAPIARNPSRIDVVGPGYSMSYIRQTIEMMTNFGITLKVDEETRHMQVTHAQGYRPTSVELTGDYTSASYILGAAFVTHGNVLLRNLDPASLQGEKKIIDILTALGAKIHWIPGVNALRADCTDLPRSVDMSFDLSDCPNILPTVAAVAAIIPGRVRISGGRLTQHHKSHRIDAMATELTKAGVPVSIVRSQEGFIDGLEINGKLHHGGGTQFSSHGDHRILMAMILFALACARPCEFDGDTDTSDSFPEFTERLIQRHLNPSPASPLEMRERIW